jgi:hypothetical protein
MVLCCRGRTVIASLSCIDGAVRWRAYRRFLESIAPAHALSEQRLATIFEEVRCASRAAHCPSICRHVPPSPCCVASTPAQLCTMCATAAGDPSGESVTITPDGVALLCRKWGIIPNPKTAAGAGDAAPPAFADVVTAVMSA